MPRLHIARPKMSRKKKAAAIFAAVLTLALLMGGVLAYTDFTQNAINRFRGSGDPDILLHDDFDSKTGDKRVYVENTGSVPMIVRVQFAEFLQVGNDILVGGNSTDKSTWEVHKFTAPNIENCGLISHNYFQWIMSGNQVVFLPGLSEIGYKEYNEGDIGPNGNIAKKTLPYAPVIPIALYVADPDSYDDDYPDGMWVVDEDGWCYWTKGLKSGEATNLLLEKVLIINAPDDSYYYAIDVRLQAANFTESYKLYSGSLDPGDGKYDKDGEKATDDGIIVIEHIINSSGGSGSAHADPMGVDVCGDLVFTPAKLTGAISWSIEPAVPGITVDGSGKVSVAFGVPLGTPFTVKAEKTNGSFELWNNCQVNKRLVLSLINLDPNFEKVIKNGHTIVNAIDGSIYEQVIIDTDGDGILVESEIKAVTSLNVEGTNITSLKGVGYFSELTTLWCTANFTMTSLDVSGLKKLTELYCWGNALTSLILTGSGVSDGSGKASGAILEEIPQLSTDPLVITW